MNKAQAMREAADYMDSLINKMEEGITSVNAVLHEISSTLDLQDDKEILQYTNHATLHILAASRSIARLQWINNDFRKEIELIEEPDSPDTGSGYGTADNNAAALTAIQGLIDSLSPGEAVTIKIINATKEIH